MAVSRSVRLLSVLGPGIAIAATGVGAGDFIASTNAGARYGELLLWAAVYGAILKFTVNEGVARWQLATGTTMLEGWVERFGRPLQYFFLIYLLIWSYFVGSGLISACGLAGHALFPRLSVNEWGIIHSLAGLAIVWFGRYSMFERAMKWMAALMFAAFILSALALRPSLPAILKGVVLPAVPSGSVASILSVLGGIGGSLTILCYGYWIKEVGRSDASWLRDIRIDLGCAYLLTALFGISVNIIGAQIKPEAAGSQAILTSMGDQMEAALGPVGRYTLYLGFWGAVATSLLGVWQGIPYMFADFVALVRRAQGSARDAIVAQSSPWYRGFLLFLALPTQLALLLDQPVSLVLVYTLIGALFMPFLAATLLYMNTRRDWVGRLRSGWLSNSLLLLALALFAYLSVVEVRRFIEQNWP
jgi:Mn2+/Fe2+ NRAMP family transporter